MTQFDRKPATGDGVAGVRMHIATPTSSVCVANFGLALHDEKTRLIEFGRLPALARRQRGLRRPETFAFLGFTHYCGWTRDGRFIVKLKT
jgi:hypothetical protein